MAEFKIVCLGLVIYFQILIFYGLMYMEIIGSRPDGISDCFAIDESNRSWTKDELSIRTKIEGKDIDSVNVSDRFRVLVAYGFWIQLIWFVVELSQMFFKPGDDDDEDFDDIY